MHDGMTLIDAHTHLYHVEDIDNIPRYMGYTNQDAVNILCMTQYDEPYMANNVLAILAKATYPDRCFVFGGLHHCLPGAADSDKDLARQARVLIEAGCDGIKMLEGKPNARKRLGLRLDAPEFDGFYDYMQSQGRPILAHVVDPDICWDKEHCPEPFRKCGYYYADEPFLDVHQIRRELASVLKRFPRLQVILAHLYSMSEDMPGLRRFLDEHPNAMLDLAPGGDMYVSFAKDPAAWREFFVTYQDRIVLGSDATFPAQESPCPNLAGQIRDLTKGRKFKLILKFLETDQVDTMFEDDDIRGISLDRPAVAQILAGNFKRVAGKTPRPLDLDRCLTYGRWIMEFARRSAHCQAIVADLEPALDRLRQLRR